MRRTGLAASLALAAVSGACRTGPSDDDRALRRVRQAPLAARAAGGASFDFEFEGETDVTHASVAMSAFLHPPYALDLLRAASGARAPGTETVGTVSARRYPVAVATSDGYAVLPPTDQMTYVADVAYVSEALGFPPVTG